jgi:hypothetical protein
MGKRRIIDSKIRTSQSFASFTYRQRDLWQGLIATADDQGRMPGTPAYIRSVVWPYDDLSIREVEDDLNAIVSAGNIVQYEFDGCWYIQIVNWWKYQSSQWAAPSDYPARSDWQDRVRYHGKGNKLITLSWDKPGGFIDVIYNEDSGVDRREDSALSRRDINDDVNDDIKDEDEADVEIDDAGITGDLAPLSIAFVNATQIPELTGGVDKWFKALEEMHKAGVIPSDVTQAVTEMRNRNYSIVGPRSIVNPSITVMSKRMGSKGNQDPKRFFTGEFGEFVEH